MNAFPGKSNIMGASAGFAAVGGFVLLAVLAPSPARFALWDVAQPTALDLRFPEAARMMSKTELDAIAEHPLFNTDRKKDPPAVVEGALPGLATYRLAGVIATGTSGIAIVERKLTKASITLKAGDMLDGRKVMAITAEGVTFSSTAGNETLGIPKVYGADLSQHPENQAGAGEDGRSDSGVKEHR